MLATLSLSQLPQFVHNSCKETLCGACGDSWGTAQKLGGKEAGERRTGTGGQEDSRTAGQEYKWTGGQVDRGTEGQE